MPKTYKGSLSLEWHNKQKAILLLNEQSSSSGIPAPQINWINKDEALFYEIRNSKSLGVVPYWVSRDDIRVKEARPLVFKMGYKSILKDTPGTLPGTETSYEIEETDDQADIENILIKGDNLLALNSLKKHFENVGDEGKIKCVIIDPPYNTGSAFEQYDDNFEHSEWLTLMRDRLQIIKNLLKEDGSIWIILDDNELHYCKVLMDEIFGRQNFVSSIVWQKVFAKKNKALISSSHDTILVYTKDISKWDRNLIQRDEEQLQVFKNPDNDHRGAWQSVSYSVQSEDSEKRKAYRYEITTPSGIVVSPPTGRHWNGLPDRTEELRRENRLWFGPNGDKAPRIKVFLNEVKEGIVPDTWWEKELLNDDVIKTEILTILKSIVPFNRQHSWWNHEESGNNQEAKKEMLSLFPNQEPFSTPKPEKLIHRIIQIATNENDIVFDCFGGSGTTYAVAHKMKRKWIGIEIGNHADTHIIPRMIRVMKNTVKSEVTEMVNWKGGGSFKYYHLGPSIINHDEKGAGDFNWPLDKKFIEESLLLSYDYLLDTTFSFQADQLFHAKGSRPTIGIQKIGTKTRVAIVSLNEPNDGLGVMPYDEIQSIYKSIKSKFAPEYINIFTNRGVEIAYDSKPDDLEIIKVPHAIFAELEK